MSRSHVHQLFYALLAIVLVVLLRLCISGRVHAAGPVSFENTLTGSLPTEWEVSGVGDSSIQGFATDVSVSMSKNRPLSITLTGRDTDGDSLTFMLLTLPTHDVVSPTGSVASYTSRFTADRITAGIETQGAAYTATLGGAASDTETGGTLTYTKASGSDWLIVAGNGALSGTPGQSDVGQSNFVVRVTDG